ncbi:hypothetical protein GHT07_05030 [Caenimonas koreensis DSM 17982]|uniref:Protease inhibitor Inh n=2 Tax=Caenimonas TaxID=763439 RepID=A0A844B4M2_9BURK|nr:hypothetical protein [Caenimonas koreensis]MRD46629.1 hypothetical protein [Caenimonas koreensis DSM 17982]
MIAKTRLTMLAACAILSVATSAVAQEQAWTGEQIKAAWVGKKVFGRSATGGLIDFHMRADGTATVATGNLVDSGTWRAIEAGYCATWKKIRAGEERCFKVVNRNGKVLVLNPDGAIGTEILNVVD